LAFPIEMAGHPYNSAELLCSVWYILFSSEMLVEQPIFASDRQ